MDVVGTVANLTTMTAWGIGVGDHEEVVFAVFLDDARTFKEAFLVFLALEDVHVSALDDVGEIGLKFHQFARAVDDEHTAVVVEEQRTVVEVAHTGDEFPRTFGLLGGENIGVAHSTLFIGSQEGIDLAVVIFQRGGPLSATVGGSLLQVVLRRIGETLEDVAYGLPILQVLRGHHGSTRHEVHSGGNEIERVAHTDHVWIGNVCPKHGVLDRRGVDGLVILSEGSEKREVKSEK